MTNCGRGFCLESEGHAEYEERETMVDFSATELSPGQFHIMLQSHRQRQDKFLCVHKQLGTRIGSQNDLQITYGRRANHP